jgi:UDP-2,3-diacylglucosamine hydrolase
MPLPSEEKSVQGALWVISDLHIVESADSVATQLIEFLAQQPRATDHVVFAGDLFDRFTGERKFLWDRFQAVLTAISQLPARGVEVTLIEGNHDLHLQPWVKAHPGICWADPGLLLNCGGKRIWIEHGDLVNQSDIGYLTLRAAFRTGWVRGLARWVPESWVDGFANNASSLSRSQNPWLPEMLPQQKLQQLRTVYRSAANQKLLNGMDCVIFGHCHDLDEVRFQVGSRLVQYINMGFPPVHGTILRLQSGAPWVERFPLFRNALT